MRKQIIRRKSVIMLGLLVLLAAPLTSTAAEPPQLSVPNIVLIYVDDLGYGDLGCFNATSKIPTPNLGQLAREGMRFTDAHSSSGICTPSRYALLTGRHHWRDFHGIVSAFGKSVFKPEQLTLPEMLKEKGYATAALDYKLPDTAAEDSHNLLPLLTGAVASVRTTHIHNTNKQHYAIRHGDWVLIDAPSGYLSGVNKGWEERHGYPPDDKRPVELYNLKTDLAQKHNVAAENPERVAELQTLLTNIREQGHSAPRLAKP